MQLKRGQIAIFFLLVVILLIGFGFIYFVNDLDTRETNVEVGHKLTSQNYAQDFENYVKNCVDLTSKDAIRTVGIQGGYIDPINYLDNFFYITSYLFYDGLSYVPSKIELELEISKYIKQNLNNCINFSIYEEQGNEFELSDIESNIAITNSSVFITVNYPITIIRPESSITISDYSAEVPVRLGYIRDIVEELVSEAVINPDWININTLTKFDLDINIRPRYTNAIVYYLTDSKSNLNYDETYKFTFVMDFDSSKYILMENTAPKLQDITGFTVNVGEPFYFDINAIDQENDKITFDAITALFDINKDTGEISFTPSDFDVGKHSILIYAKDTSDAFDYTYLDIEVIG